MAPNAGVEPSVVEADPGEVAPVEVHEGVDEDIHFGSRSPDH